MASIYSSYPLSTSGGGITSINGDTTAAQLIVGGAGISVSTSGGTTTITNTGGSGGANQTLSNLTSPTAVNQDLLTGSAGLTLGSSTAPWASLYFGTTAGTGGPFVYELLQSGTSLFLLKVGDTPDNVPNSGNSNLAIGHLAFLNSTTSSHNVAIGQAALETFNATNGDGNNTAVGYQAGYSKTDYSNCVFVGYEADASSNVGNSIAIGYEATVTASNAIQLGNSSVQSLYVGSFINAELESLSVGNFINIEYNTSHSLTNNIFIGAVNATLTTATNTIALGHNSLASLTSANSSIGIGEGASNSITTCNFTIAVGDGALNSASVTSGNTDGHVAIGYQALNNYGTSTSGGDGMVAVGPGSFVNAASGDQSVAVGNNAGSVQAVYNQVTLLGAQADTGSSGLSNATAIGYQASVAASNTIQLGNSSVTGVYTDGAYYSGGSPVPVTDGSITNYGVVSIDSSGKLTTVTTGQSSTGWVLTSNSLATPPTWQAAYLSLWPNLTQYGAMYASSYATLNSTSPGTAGQVLTSAGGTAAPAFGDIDLTGVNTALSGALPVASGGTGRNTVQSIAQANHWAGWTSTAALEANSFNAFPTPSSFSGSAGTMVAAMPFQGGSYYQKVIVYLNGFTDTGTQVYTFPTAFGNTPYMYGATAAVAAATVSTTTISFTGTTLTGFVFLEGY